MVHVETESDLEQENLLNTPTHNQIIKNKKKHRKKTVENRIEPEASQLRWGADGTIWCVQVSS